MAKVAAWFRARAPVCGGLAADAVVAAGSMALLALTGRSSCKEKYWSSEHVADSKINTAGSKLHGANIKQGIASCSLSTSYLSSLPMFHNVPSMHTCLTRSSMSLRHVLLRTWSLERLDALPPGRGVVSLLKPLPYSQPSGSVLAVRTTNQPASPSTEGGLMAGRAAPWGSVHALQSKGRSGVPLRRQYDCARIGFRSSHQALVRSYLH